jgi:hypothetical protein
MKRLTVRIVIGTALLFVGYFVGHGSTSVVQAAQDRAMTANIPKAFGRCIGSMGSGLIFEDGNGTIRLVDPDNGHVTNVVNRN